MEPGNSDKKPTVLVAEDDVALRRALVATLAKKGYPSLEASDGSEAWSLYLRYKPQAVITDYLMPKMNGEALIERIKFADPAACALLTTGEISDSVILDLLRFDRFAALHKPYNAGSLLAAFEYVQSLPLEGSNITFRKAKRVDLAIPVMIELHGPATTLNLSTQGTFLATDAKIRAGAELMMTLELPKPLPLIGTVVWVREANQVPAGPEGVGVRFGTMPPQAQAELRELLMNELRRTKRPWL